MKKIIKQRFSYRRKKHINEYLTDVIDKADALLVSAKMAKQMNRKDMAEELKRIRKEDA